VVGELRRRSPSATTREEDGRGMGRTW
jgi:hypothetical protein